MEAAFKRGLEEIRAGRYFEAHEELEEAWRAAPPEERDFFQGLVHVAVAWYQAGRGRPVATGRQSLITNNVAANKKAHLSGGLHHAQIMLNSERHGTASVMPPLKPVGFVYVLPER